MRFYVLDRREPRRVSFMQWLTWSASANLDVGWTKAGWKEISTVFVGYNFRHPTLLFRTTVLDTETGGRYVTRCATWAEAEAMHAMAVARAKTGIA